MRSRAIPVLDGALPCLVGENLELRTTGIEKEGTSAAAQMAESSPTHKPDKNGNPVGSFFQIRSNLDFIIIPVSDGWSSFKASLIDNKLAIDPKPVLCVNGDSRYKRSWNFLNVNIFTESEPGIGLVFVILFADPLGFPGILLRSGLGSKSQDQSSNN